MLRQDRNKKSKARKLKFLKIWRIFFWSIISIVWYPTNSGTKKFCLRNNFCSVFYVLESKKKLRSYPKIFEKKNSKNVKWIFKEEIFQNLSDHSDFLFFCFPIQYTLDLRKPDLRKNLDLGKIVAATD